MNFDHLYQISNIQFFKYILIIIIHHQPIWLFVIKYLLLFDFKSRSRSTYCSKYNDFSVLSFLWYIFNNSSFVWMSSNL